MYQPRIDDSYVRLLFRFARARGVPMTQALNSILHDFFEDIEIVEENIVAEKREPQTVYRIVS